MNKAKIKFLFAIIIGSTLLFSCVPQRKMVLLQHHGNIENNTLLAVKSEFKVPRIQKGDELYVRVTSFEENERYNFFNLSLPGMNVFNNQVLSLVGHVVDINGNITFPVVGDIKVEGLTLEEAGKKIEEAVTPYVNKPTVSVRIINKNVTVIGYVREPGQFDISHERMNILQAIGRAGDFQDYGNRKKVLLIREEDNKIERIYIDLTKEDILESDYYYLKPGDIIYVEPLRRRIWGINNFPFALLIGALTPAVLIYNLVK